MVGSLKAIHQLISIMPMKQASFSKVSRIVALSIEMRKSVVAKYKKIDSLFLCAKTCLALTKRNCS